MPSCFEELICQTRRPPPPVIGFYEMQIVVNGNVRDFSGLAPAPTLAGIVEALDLKGDRIAVEHNGSIVSRADWPTTPVADGDKLEVVHFVGGGSDKLGGGAGCRP